MKALFIIVEQALEPDVLAVFERLRIEHYTSWGNVKGSGRTGRKDGSPIWPGLNMVFLVLLDEPRVPTLVGELERLRDSLPLQPGLRVFSTQAEGHC